MMDSVQFCTVPIVALEGTPELIEPSREAETSELEAAHDCKCRPSSVC